MTHLASSWRLWKLQFLSGSWLTRTLALFFGMAMVFGVPLTWPVWGPILVPFVAIPSLWFVVASGENVYRAFGMNRARAAAHSALTISPVVIVVVAFLLVLHPTASGVIGAVVSLVVGAVCVYWSDPTGLSVSDAAYEGSVLPGAGGFAWRVLWRGLLIGAVAFGAVAGVAEIVAYILPWEWLAQFMHGFVSFAFWLWLATRLMSAAGAWTAFGYTRRAWVQQFIPASVAGGVMMNAVFAAVIALLTTAGWVPSGMDVDRVLSLIAISTLLAIAIPFSVASVRSGSSFFAMVFAMMAWFANREYSAGFGTPQTYLYFTLIFSAVLLAIAGFGLWRLLTGRSVRSARSDFLGTATR